jgi:predicted hotdog family 3-hydroxylacyl-ACP dehydratase
MIDRPWRVADLLPHTGSAVLLDDVVGQSETSLSTSVTIGPGSAFRQSNGVPVHVGIEYMAQTCGVFSGVRARSAGEMPRLGFLLGTRRYLATRAWFVDGERLVVSSELAWRDEEIGVFDCLIRSGDDVVAQAQLIVSEPKSVPGSPGWSE